MKELLIILYLAFEIGAIIVALHDLYGEKLKLDVWTVVLFLLNVTTLYIMARLGVANEYAFLMYFMIFLYTLLRFKRDYKKIIINFALCFVSSSVIQFLIALIYSLFFNNGEYWYIHYFFVNFVLLIILSLTYRKKRLHALSNVFMNYNLLIILALVVDAVIVFACIYQVKETENVLVGVILLFIVVTILLFSMAISLGKSIINNKQLETAISIQNMYNDSFEGLISAIRSKQHDFDNHINALLGFCHTCNTYEDLIREQNNYFGGIADDSKYHKLLLIGNCTLAGFLYTKFSNVDEHKVNIKYNIICGNFDSKVPMHKIVELLGNLIDNAIEALYLKSTIGIMLFNIEETADQIICEISNESDYISNKSIRNFFDKGVSSKGVNRGFGLYNVREICKEYNLELICKNMEIDKINYFSIKIVFSKDAPMV